MYKEKRAIENLLEEAKRLEINLSEGDHPFWLHVDAVEIQDAADRMCRINDAISDERERRS